VVSVSPERFEQMVADALDSLPPDLGRAMDNVAVVVGDKAEGRPLFGLYEGVPLIRRGTYAGAVPDRITIYQDTICERCTTEA
jgi:predicted Zn-dependent protease with MMP-like domain